MATEMEITLNLILIFNVIMGISLIVLGYWFLIYRGGLMSRIHMKLMGSKSGDARRMKKINRLIKKDLTELIINENPELIRQFPATMDLAADNPDWLPDIAGGLTGVLGTILLRGIGNTVPGGGLVGSSLRATDMEQQVVTRMVSPMITGLFKWFAGGDKKKKKEEKPGSSGNVI